MLLQNFLIIVNKAQGSDYIKYSVMKETTIVPNLTAIFKISLDTGKVAEEWRTANVTPVFKKGTGYTASNYRPVSVKCISNKLMGILSMRKK